MDIKKNETIISMVKEMALNEVISEHTYDKSNEEVFDIIMEMESEGYCPRVPDEITLWQPYENFYLNEFQTKLEEAFDAQMADIQSVFNVFIPKNIELQSGGTFVANKLVADLSLKDALDNNPLTPARISISEQGVGFGIEGFGDAVSDGLESQPILFEQCDGVIRTCFWNNINHEDVTDIMELSDESRIEKRLED